jgi:WD40 repeat protein
MNDHQQNESLFSVKIFKSIFSPDRKYIVSGTSTGNIIIHNSTELGTANVSCLLKLTIKKISLSAHKGAVYALEWASIIGGKLLLFSAADSEIRAWDWNQYKEPKCVLDICTKDMETNALSFNLHVIGKRIFLLTRLEKLFI